MLNLPASCACQIIKKSKQYYCSIIQYNSILYNIDHKDYGIIQKQVSPFFHEGHASILYTKIL